MPREHSAHDMQLTTFQIQHATRTFGTRHATDNIPDTTCYGNIRHTTRQHPHEGGGSPPLFSARELPALSPRSTFKPLGGVKVERFSGPAVLRRCCPLSSERVACCQSPRESRGAASVLPFFRGRAEEVARSLVEDAAGENLTTSLRRSLPSLLVAPLDLGSELGRHSFLTSHSSSPPVVRECFAPPLAYLFVGEC